MSDNAFIFMLVLGMSVLAGILTVAHVSAYRLKQRLQQRQEAGAVAPEMAPVMEPQLDLGDVTRFIDNPGLTVRIRHAETAR